MHRQFRNILSAFCWFFSGQMFSVHGFVVTNMGSSGSRMSLRIGTKVGSSTVLYSSSYELLYFDLPGRAEAIRICLSAAGIDFKDTRFTFEEWPNIKPTTPLGSVPVLKIDGKQHCQSVALARYAGKLSGFYPEDPLEALNVDEVLDTINEMFAKLPVVGNPDEIQKLQEEFQAGPMTQCAKFVEGMVRDNHIASTPSIADLTIQSWVVTIQSGFLPHVDTKFFDDYPGILSVVDAISKNEKILAYYASKK